MKTAYPIILVKEKDQSGYNFAVNVPDLGIWTQGKNIVDAIEMAEDAISLWIVTSEEENKQIPAPHSVEIEPLKSNEKQAYAIVDIDSFRRKLDNRMVRRNVTLPNWLNKKAEEAGLNVSGVLQEALKEHLNLK